MYLSKLTWSGFPVLLCLFPVSGYHYKVEQCVWTTSVSREGMLFVDEK